MTQRSTQRTSLWIVELDDSGLLDNAEAVILKIYDADPSDGYGAMWEYIELE